MVSLSIPSMLRQCVNLHPDGTAFTYIDYERDSEGISESLTWSQVYRRTLNVAAEVRRHAAIGDRAVILAHKDSIILLLFWALYRPVLLRFHFRLRSAAPAMNVLTR